MTDEFNLPSKSCSNCKYHRTGSDICEICSYRHGNGGLKWEHFDEFVNAMYKMREITRGVDYQLMLNQIFDLGVRAGENNAYIHHKSCVRNRGGSARYRQFEQSVEYMEGFEDGIQTAIGTFNWNFVLEKMPPLTKAKEYEVGDWEPHGEISDPVIVTDGGHCWIAVYYVQDGEADHEGSWRESYYGYKLDNIKMWAEFQPALPVSIAHDDGEAL